MAGYSAARDTGALAAVRAVVDVGGADSAARALRAAAENGAVGVAEALLHVGVDVNAPDDDDGACALMLAAKHGRGLMVELVRAPPRRHPHGQHVQPTRPTYASKAQPTRPEPSPRVHPYLQRPARAAAHTSARGTPPVRCFLSAR